MNPEIGKMIKLYPRTIFVIDKATGKKTITNAIIIDGAFESSKDIMKFLYSINWETKYMNTNFVPFRTSTTLPTDDQKQAMEYHNNYLNSTYRTIVKVANPTMQFEIDDGEKISFKNWLLQSKLHGVQMIQGVETMKDGMVRIIYDKQHQEGVDFIMKTLKDNAVDAFGEEIAINMLGDDFDVVTYFNSELEDQHAQKLKSSWQGKVINHISPPTNQHKLYYGSNKSENLYPQNETRSYSEVTQSTMSMSDTQIADSRRENEELRNMVVELQNKFEQMEKNHQSFAKTLKASIKRELMKEFEGLVEDFKTEMSTTIATIEKKFDDTISTIEKKFDDTIATYEKPALERETRMQEQSLSNFRIVAAEILSKQKQITPSETSPNAEGLRGGDK